MGDASDQTIVLALNSGSSSLKLALYSFCNGEVCKLASAAAEEIGGEAAGCGCAESPRCSSMNLEAALARQRLHNI